MLIKLWKTLCRLLSATRQPGKIDKIKISQESKEKNFFPSNHRIEYDAYRSDLEVLLQSTSSGQSSALADAQRAHDEHKIEFEKIRADLSIKLRFLNENRVKVRFHLITIENEFVNLYCIW